MYFVFKIKFLLPHKVLLRLLLCTYFSVWVPRKFLCKFREICLLTKENGISINRMVQGSLQTDGRVLLPLNFCNGKLVHTEKHSSMVTCVFSKWSCCCPDAYSKWFFALKKKKNTKKSCQIRAQKITHICSEWISVSNINMTSVIFTHFFLVTEKNKNYYKDVNENLENIFLPLGQFLNFI